MIDSQLTSLLTSNRSNPVVADCLKRISHADKVKYQSGGSAPLNEIIEIYSRRARINSKLNDGVAEGFDDLLPSLKAATIARVRLHSLEFLSHWFTIFTDESTSHLYGVLKSPKQKAALYDPVKGYDG